MQLRPEAPTLVSDPHSQEPALMGGACFCLLTVHRWVPSGSPCSSFPSVVNENPRETQIHITLGALTGSHSYTRVVLGSVYIRQDKRIAQKEKVWCQLIAASSFLQGVSTAHQFLLLISVLFPIFLSLLSQISFVHGKCLEHFFFQLTLVALRFMHLYGIYK